MKLPRIQPFTEASTIAALKRIDPEVKLEPHPTILYAMRCTPSKDWYLGPLIIRMHYLKPVGILVSYLLDSEDYIPTMVFDIEPKQLTRWQRFIRWLA